ALRGQRFGGKVGPHTRPTGERVREAIGSIFASRGRFDDARVLDLFAGTGALGFEALSRGARGAVLVDVDPQVERQLRQSAQTLGVEARARILRVDLLRSPDAVIGALSGEPPFDLILADPPYAVTARVVPLLDALADAGLFTEDALCVVEYDRKTPPPLTPTIAMVADYRYGDTAVALLARAESMG